MSDYQNKKKSAQEKKFRDQVNDLIEKAYQGQTINDIITSKIESKRGTYYRNVKKRPLTRKFIKMVKDDLGVDISILNDTINNTSDYLEPVKSKEEESWEIKYEKSLNEKIDLLRENKELFDRTIEQKKLISFYETTIEKLTDEIKQLKEHKNQG